ENPKGAVLMGFSPVRLGALNWMLGAAVASVAGVLISPISGVNPFNYSLFVVPALAAALAGRLRSFGVAMATALAIGAFEGLTVHLVSREQVPTLLLGGFDSLVPFVVIVGMLVLAGRTIPDRGTVFDRRQPVVPVPGRHPVRHLVLVGVAVAAMAFGDSALRLSAVTSMIVTILCLSIVVLTGYVGQVSLAQLTLAGFSAFMLATASDRWGLPFPVAPAVAVAFATALGLAISLPALRIRGMQFAIVTLAAAVAIEQLLFRSPVFTGPGGTAVVRPPSIAGFEFGILGDREYPDVWFGLLALGITLLSIFVVTSVRRSGLGRRMLAVRANERAAAAAGVDLARTKLAAAGIASAIAGLAGVVFAYKNVQFGWAGLESSRGLQIIALAFLGGVGSVGGAVIAGLIAPSGVILVALGSPAASGTQLVVTGLGLLVVTIAFPAGIAGAGPWLRRMVTRVGDAGRGRPSVPDDASAVEVFVVDVGDSSPARSGR
nr:hypothetical protein [Ilumatobacteraceae bacterium]